MTAARDAWQKWLILVAIVTAVLAWASIPGRVDALERRVGDLEKVQWYMACVLNAQSRAQDPRACESHLSPDLVNFLRPGGL